MTITISTRRLLTIALVALGVLAAFVLGSSRSAGASPTATDSPARLLSVASTTSTGQPGGITVTGTGTVSGVPDTVLVSMHVTADGSTVSAAFATANASAAAVQKSWRSHGVAAIDMRTSDVSLQPRWTNSGSVDGYTVDESLTVTLHDVSKAGEQISAAVAAGGNHARLDGVSLDVSDTSPVVSQARDAAFAQAKAKAEQYAGDAGRSLGPVVSLTDAAQTSPVPVDFAVRAMAPAASSVPISPGSQDVQVQVTVTFGLS
jgi:uncharacterized protein